MRVANCLLLTNAYNDDNDASSLRKFYGRYDYLIQLYETQQFQMKSWKMTIFFDTLNLSDITLTRDFVTELGLVAELEFREVSENHL